jgi:hypothetical protein
VSVEQSMRSCDVCSPSVRANDGKQDAERSGERRVQRRQLCLVSAMVSFSSKEAVGFSCSSKEAVGFS